MQLKTLLASLDQPWRVIQPANGQETYSETTDIQHLAYDSRLVEPGSLFIAVAGTHTDGRLYIDAAARQGAVIALGEPLESSVALPLPFIEVANVRTALADLASAFYDYPARQLCMIGVTGTDGKTTTSNLISTIFEQAGVKTGLMTTANFKVSGREWENTSRQSTLESLEIQKFLRQMLDEGVTHAVVESTSHGLMLERVRGCLFDVAVITNITSEHLDFHKTLENYRRAKARLFEMLDPGRDKGLGAKPVAILNRDDSSYDLLKSASQAPVLDYSIDGPADIYTADLQLLPSHTQFRAILPDGEIEIHTRLVGRFNVSNCLAAIATAYSQGIPPKIIAQGLASVSGVSGRMEKIDEGQDFTVIVDYAHTPDSLEKVLATLRPLTKGKLIVVFGSAGERDELKRPVMGRVAAKMADFSIITDEDPRDEDREKILRAIAEGAEAEGKQAGQDFLCIADRTEAIAAAFHRAKAGDTVLLAGKGHEQSIIIGREKLPWDDRRVARELIHSLKTVQ